MMPFRRRGDFVVCARVQNAIERSAIVRTPSVGWGNCMSLWIYLGGYLVLITGLAIGAHLLHVEPQWIGVGALCLLGIGVVHGVSATRQKDVAT